MSQAVLQGMPTVSIYGIRFSKMNMADTVNYLTDRVERREPTQVITGNPIMIMTALEQQSFHKVMLEAELVVPDGTGVVWAASYIGDPVTERVAGFDLLHRLMEVGEAAQLARFPARYNARNYRANRTEAAAAISGRYDSRLS